MLAGADYYRQCRSSSSAWGSKSKPCTFAGACAALGVSMPIRFLFGILDLRILLVPIRTTWIKISRAELNFLSFFPLAIHLIAIDCCLIFVHFMVIDNFSLFKALCFQRQSVIRWSHLFSWPVIWISANIYLKYTILDSCSYANERVASHANANRTLVEFLDT